MSTIDTMSINPDKTWVTSDTHFGHLSIVGFCLRPDEHEEFMVREWAENVPEDATLLHLGDLSYRNNSWFEHMIAPKLTGSPKLLIPGNHDKQRGSFYRKCGFKLIKEFEIRYDKWTVSFSHYPLTEPPAKTHIRIHGHVHNNGYSGKEAPFTPFAAQQINVSVEMTHYRPVNLDVLLKGYLYGAY